MKVRMHRPFQIVHLGTVVSYSSVLNFNLELSKMGCTYENCTRSTQLGTKGISKRDFLTSFGAGDFNVIKYSDTIEQEFKYKLYFIYSNNIVCWFC